MNMREGMRRVGLTLGALGCVAGGVFGYWNLQNVWRSHTRFERLQALPVMGDINAAIKDYPLREHGPWDDYAPFPIRAAGVSDRTTANDRAAEITVDGGGIEGIQTVNADKTGAISSILLTTGEWVHRGSKTVEARLVFIGTLLLSLCYPTVGFLIPWGTVRVFIWVAAGFSAAPAGSAT